MVDILRESVILGNDAIFKCSIPSFVSDFVSVEAWNDSEGKEYPKMSSLGKFHENNSYILFHYWKRL